MTNVVSWTNRALIGCGVLLSIVALAGTGLAQVDAVGQAGGQAAAAAQGAYHADATGAMDATDEKQSQARHKAADHVRNSGTVAENAEADATSRMNASYERPECDCRDTIQQVEEQGHGQFATAEHVEQKTGVENEYVDAGANVEVTGQAEGWYDQLFSGVTDAFDKVQGLLQMDSDVSQKAQAEVDQRLDTDDKLRDKVASQLEQEQDLPDAQPRTQGEVGARHAASAASSTVTGASAP